MHKGQEQSQPEVRELTTKSLVHQIWRLVSSNNDQPEMKIATVWGFR